jgi:F-type H+-transporting ATPase subunit delta
MSDFTTAARPYARAVFELARDAGDFSAWSEQLALIAAVASDSEMRTVLEAPGLGNSRRAEMIISVCADHITQPSCNFLRLVAENGRLALLLDIAAQYEIYRAEAEGITAATVVSAQALSDDQQANIIAALSKRLGGRITLVCETDESLLGGAIVRAGDLVIDGSVRGRLDKLAQQLSR